MRYIRSICMFCGIVLPVYGWVSELSEERKLTTNCSSMSLKKVPANLAPTTVTLDLSYNLLTELQSSDFRSLSKLNILILCHNRIQALDIKTFEFNKELKYLDLSYNRLRTVTWYSLADLRHLDLSFNDFDTMPICEELGNMSHLEVLGLSGAKIQKSDFQKISNLHLSTVFLGLITLSHYEEGSLPILNTTKLHIVLPMNTNFWVLLRDGIKTSKILEMTNIDGKSQFSSYETQKNLILSNSKTSILLLRNIDLLWDDLLLIFQFVWHTSVEYFQIEHVTFGGMVYLDHNSFDYSNTVMRTIKLEHVHFRIFNIPQESVYLLFTKMDIENLTILDAQMPHMLFPIYPTRFQYLNFANNILTDELFRNPIQLPHLKTLILKGNKLETISLVSCFAKNTSLEFLDLSQNLLQHENNENCFWPETLITMNLSSNTFAESVFRCLPTSIQILDLTNNRIHTVPKEIIQLKSLQELHLAFNFLTDLPGCSHFKKLSVLNIEMNLILSPSRDFFQTCHKVSTLNAGRNPFRCTCELRNFIQLEKYSKGMLFGWPDSYICEYPLNLKGTLLKDVHLSELSCNTALLIFTAAVITLVLGMAVAFCCRYFDLLWYLRMLGQWAQTWPRVRKTTQQLNRNVQFRLFISYSEHDSAWVKQELIPNLEKENGSVLICLPEGNFDPGKTVNENILNCIEQSSKSILVLSPNFVQSEWCHYELYFAHHTLLEISHSTILILLEPVPLYCIPMRYPKLKALMEQKAYLEWPKDRRKCGLFWATLQATINVHLLETRDMCELQTFKELNEKSSGSAISLIIEEKSAFLNFAKLYFKNMLVP